MPEGQRSVAPVIGTGESARRARATWQKELVAHLDKHKRYPKERQQKSAEIAEFASRSTAWADVLCDRYRKGLGRSGLRRGGAGDGAALRSGADGAACSVSPIADEGLTFTLPVIFRVKNKS